MDKNPRSISKLSSPSDDKILSEQSPLAPEI